MNNEELQNQTNRTIERVKNMFISLSSMVSTFKDIALNSTEGLFQGASEYTQTAAREFTNLVGSPILGIIEGLTGLTGQALWKLLYSPIGLIIVICCMAITFLAIGGAVGNVRLFIDGTNRVVTIVFGGLAFVYRIITTPFGYIFKPIGTFFINRGENYQRFLRQQEEGEEYVPNRKYGGGRKRKTRKTDKNKKNKTRKNRRGKKHNTRHRRRRLTIRR
jgi:hypothetical protein